MDTITIISNFYKYNLISDIIYHLNCFVTGHSYNFLFKTFNKIPHQLVYTILQIASTIMHSVTARLSVGRQTCADVRAAASNRQATRRGASKWPAPRLASPTTPTGRAYDEDHGRLSTVHSSWMP